MRSAPSTLVLIEPIVPGELKVVDYRQSAHAIDARTIGSTPPRRIDSVLERNLNVGLLILPYRIHQWQHSAEQVNEIRSRGRHEVKSNRTLHHRARHQRTDRERQEVE